MVKSSAAKAILLAGHRAPLGGRGRDLARDAQSQDDAGGEIVAVARGVQGGSEWKVPSLALRAGARVWPFFRVGF